MTVVLFDGTLDVDYGFGALTRRNAEIPDLDRVRAGQSNGLLGAGVRGALALKFGLHDGPEPLRVEWNETEPAISEGWEEIVEASVNITSKKRHLSAFAASIELELPEAGPHRARFCANGMDAARDLQSREADEPAPDRYLLQLWQAPAAPDQVVRQTSNCAAYWHLVARGEKQPLSSEEEDLAELAAAFTAANDEAQVEAVAYIMPVPRSGRVDVHNMAWRRMQAATAFRAALSEPLRAALAGRFGPAYCARWALDDQWASQLHRIEQGKRTDSPRM